MAKKVYVEERVVEVSKPKKKKGCCFKCCISTLIITIVLLGAGIGVGWYFGDKLLKENYDASLSQCFAVIRNFKNYKEVEKKELNNPFTESNADDFVDSLGEAILLKDIDKAEIKTIFTNLIEDMLTEAEEGEEKSVDTSALFDLFGDDNINIEKLKDFDEANIEDYYLNIKDKELAAFINEIILKTALKNIDLTKSDSDFIKLSELKLDELAGLSQITFYKDSEGEAHMSLYIRLEVKSAVDSLASQIDGEILGAVGAPDNGFLKALVKPAVFLGKSFLNLVVLPKKLYISTDINLVDASKTTISLNRTTQDDIDLINKMTDNAVDKQLEPILGKEGTIQSMMDKIGEVVPLNEAVKDNSIKFDVLQLGLDYLINNNLEEGKQRAKSSDIYAIPAMNSEKTIEDKQKPDYLQYTFEKSGNDYVLDADGMPKIIGLDEKREITKLDEAQQEYEEALLYSFSEYYGLDTTKVSNLSDLLEMMKGGIDIQDMFDADKIYDIIDGNAQELVLDERMVAALVGSSLGSFIDESEFDTGSIIPRYICLTMPEDSNGDKHNILEIGIQIMVHELMSEVLDESLADYKGFITAILPSSMLIRAEIDITLNKPNEFYLPNIIYLDRYGKEKTESIFGTLDAIMTLGGGETFSFDDVLDQLVGVKDVINSISETIPISIGESALIVPDVFEAMAKILSNQMDIEITKAELEANLKFVVEENLDTLFTAGGAVEKFQEDYAIKDDKELDDIMDAIKDTVSGEGTTTGFIDLVDDDKVKTMAGSGANDLEIDASMFAELLLNAIKDDEEVSQYINEESLKDLELSQEVLTDGKHSFAKFTISLSIKDLLDKTQGSSTSDTAMIDFLASVAKNDLFLTVKVDITTDPAITERHSTYEINGDAGKTSDLVAFLSKLGVDIDDSADRVMTDFQTEIVKLLNSINDSDVAKISQDDDKFVMSNLFEVMANVVTNSLSTEGETITEQEIQDTINYLLNEANPAIDKGLDFNNYYYDSSTPKHKDNITDNDLITDTNKVDFSVELFKDLKVTYALKDRADGASDDYDLNDLLGMLGVGSTPDPATPANPLLLQMRTAQADALELSDIIDTDKFLDLVFEDLDTNMVISRLLFSGLVKSQWANFMGSNTNLAVDSFKYSNIIIGDGTNGTALAHHYIVVAIEIDLSDYLNDDILNKFFTEKTLISMMIDVTDGLVLPEKYSETVFNINEVGADKTKGLLETIEKMGLDLNFGSIEESARKVFKEIKDTIGLEFKENGGEDIIEMPNIFALVKELAYKDTVGLTGANIKTVLRGIHYDRTGTAGFSTKYIKNPIERDEIVLADLMQTKIAEATSGFDTTPPFAPGTVDIALSDAEIGKLIAQEIEDDTNKTFNGTIKSLNILSSSGSSTGTNAQTERTRLNTFDSTDTINFGTTDFISVIFEMKLDDLTTGGTMPDIAQKILPTSFYATMLMDCSSGFTFYNNYFRINDMTKADQANLYKMFGIDSTTINSNINSNFTSCSGHLTTVTGNIDTAIGNTSLTAPLNVLKFSVDSKQFLPNNPTIGKYEYKIGVTI